LETVDTFSEEQETPAPNGKAFFMVETRLDPKRQLRIKKQDSWTNPTRTVAAPPKKGMGTKSRTKGIATRKPPAMAGPGIREPQPPIWTSGMKNISTGQDARRTITEEQVPHGVTALEEEGRRSSTETQRGRGAPN
jgi:hypothetical protein